VKSFEFLKNFNADYINALWEDYQKDPDSVDASWKYFFEGYTYFEKEFHQENGSEPKNSASIQKELKKFSSEAKVAELIAAYRSSGRLLANTNPLSPGPEKHPILELSRFNLNESHLNEKFTAGKVLGLSSSSTLTEILAHLKKTYCNSIGVEFTHIQNAEEREWLQDIMESTQNTENLDSDSQKFILQRLSESETFERFLHTRYVAQKRFSIEGGESIIPTIDRIIEIASELGAKQFVMGMAHRGRLNILHNTFKKDARYIFKEYEDTYQYREFGTGDVKYHKGYSQDITTRLGKKVHLSLAHNPSHLEFVAPVVEGVTNAKQRFYEGDAQAQVLPLHIHGDAAFAGQGIVYETLNFSKVPGFNNGGSIHLVINNQIGFTTSPDQGRSTDYCTDIAKMLQAPIFHVNADDPEALWWVAKLAVLYRYKFRNSVFIDLICYRRYGHNEGDEPAFTQPEMYSVIKKHPTTRKIYSDKLLNSAVIESSEDKKFTGVANDYLLSEQKLSKSDDVVKPFESSFDGRWSKIKPSTSDGIAIKYPTPVELKKLQAVAKKVVHIPEDFNANSKLKRIIAAREEALENKTGLDWGFVESLAFASLVSEGHPVRMTGQDCERGTFSHRHAVYKENKTGKKYIPLQNISEDQAPFWIYNSTLSESGVLGFEHGWSLADPNALVLWEAQFGDFCNSAQVIIDQFIAASEAKWNRSSGLVMYLPHGHEGQGPEHSSARLERFLQLCGENNFSVCNFTTAANLFHALRRQVKRNFRKPLIVMTPKSLLRYAPSFASLSDLSGDSAFTYVYSDDELKTDPKKVKRVLLCSGKIYFELLKHRKENNIQDTALLRIEQLYPFPEDKLLEKLKPYLKTNLEIHWVQEEPRNQGAWTYIFNNWSGGLKNFGAELGIEKIHYVGRKSAAAPSVGSTNTHKTVQNEIIHRAFKKLELLKK